ncbi:MAG: histidine kinase [Muribaculaceae bacterium]|nr:histidine kinase [Muribaculaceae bacterium]
MKLFRYSSRQEACANALLWAVMFIVPLVGMVVLSSVDNNYLFRWIDLLHIWVPLVVVLLAFLIHNYFIAPVLVYEHNRLRYVVLLSILMMVFVFYQCATGPPDPGPGGPKIIGAPPVRPIAGPHDFTMFSLLVFALGANLGLKLYFKTQAEQKQLAELENHKLRQELTYLRYQVNPHFLMNTLNNIHALVDIEPEDAKTSIVQLSRFMRYLLYESDVERISLQKAIELIDQHISLMRIRYIDNVDIRFDSPHEVPQVGVAPLIIVPFVENAFKHGVSYDKPSFIHITLAVDKENIEFYCCNSKNNVKHDAGGVGIANVTKRLDLIYGDRYTLNIDDGDDTFKVTLIVPAEPL